jgi:hypothetical protein
MCVAFFSLALWSDVEPAAAELARQGNIVAKKDDPTAEWTPILGDFQLKQNGCDSWPTPEIPTISFPSVFFFFPFPFSLPRLFIFFWLCCSRFINAHIHSFQVRGRLT